MIITEEQKQVIRKVMPNVEEQLKKGYDAFMDEFYGLILETFDGIVRRPTSLMSLKRFMTK